MISKPKTNKTDSNAPLWKKVLSVFQELLGLSDILIPSSLSNSPDNERRARLLIRFGILGTVFGLIFAGFYFSISHLFGGIVISIFVCVFALIPLGLKHSGNLRRCSNLYILCICTGFFGLSLIEGGMHGHAVAWISVVPLCAMILTNRRDAIIWCCVSVAIVGLFAYWHVSGILFPETFPAKYTNLVDAAGFGALVPFLVLLGFIFEATRRRAFSQLESAMDRLTEANEGLIKLNSEKNEFLNIAAHDLKNPLSVITGFSDLIGSIDGLSEKETKDFAAEISKSANRMLDIVTNLLDVRSIEDGNMKLKREPCRVADSVCRVHSDFEPLAEKKNIILSITHQDPDATACGDEGALSQILDNLVSNAIKYSPEGSHIRIRTGRLEDSVSIAIIDEGPGLSQEDQANLFKKFSRLTPQPTAGESSNGLGLWIVDRMATSMGGSITCDSALEKGSTFTLELPVSKSSEEIPDRDDYFQRILSEEQSDLMLPG